MDGAPTGRILWVLATSAYASVAVARHPSVRDIGWPPSLLILSPKLAQPLSAEDGSRRPSRAQAAGLVARLSQFDVIKRAAPSTSGFRLQRDAAQPELTPPRIRDSRSALHE